MYCSVWFLPLVDSEVVTGQVFANSGICICIRPIPAFAGSIGISKVCYTSTNSVIGVNGVLRISTIKMNFYIPIIAHAMHMECPCTVLVSVCDCVIYI